MKTYAYSHTHTYIYIHTRTHVDKWTHKYIITIQLLINSKNVQNKKSKKNNNNDKKDNSNSTNSHESPSPVSRSVRPGSLEPLRSSAFHTSVNSWQAGIDITSSAQTVP